MEKYYIWLIQLFGPANHIIHNVLEKYGTAENAYDAIMRGETAFLDRNQRNKLGYVTLDRAEKAIETAYKRGSSLVTIDSPDYPKLLKEIFNPPVILFYRGDLDCLNRLCITAVGSREVTPYIKKLSMRVCRDLARKGITIVSGMANGVDSCAHFACVNDGLITAGVPGCGLDFDYPKGSKILREKIVLNGGVVISELMPTAAPEPDYFRMRNRILAGLSRGTIVFQASMNSGSLITAASAVSENRDVFCVPPPDIFDRRYTGVIAYLRDGAIPLFNHDDILSQYEGLYL